MCIRGAHSHLGHYISATQPPLDLLSREALLLAQKILIFCFLSFLFIYVNSLFTINVHHVKKNSRVISVFLKRTGERFLVGSDMQNCRKELRRYHYFKNVFSNCVATVRTTACVFTRV